MLPSNHVTAPASRTLGKLTTSIISGPGGGKTPGTSDFSFLMGPGKHSREKMTSKVRPEPRGIQLGLCLDARASSLKNVAGFRSCQRGVSVNGQAVFSLASSEPNDAERAAKRWSCCRPGCRGHRHSDISNLRFCSPCYSSMPYFSLGQPWVLHKSHHICGEKPVLSSESSLLHPEQGACLRRGCLVIPASFSAFCLQLLWV